MCLVAAAFAWLEYVLPIRRKTQCNKSINLSAIFEIFHCEIAVQYTCAFNTMHETSKKPKFKDKYRYTCLPYLKVTHWF